MIVVSKRVQEFSEEIAAKAVQEAEYFPVDRYFINKYLNDILSLDRLEFIYCNLESVNNNYSVLLMACLPELWENITYEDIVRLLSNFTNTFSYYALLEFTYKYIEIDIIELVFSIKTLAADYKKQIVGYLKSQYPNFYKSEVDYFEANEGLVGIDFDKWAYLKQRFLLDNRFKPAMQFWELKEHVEKL